MKWAVWHMSGGSTTNAGHLTEVTGPFSSAIKASSWAYRKWGPSATAATIQWRVGQMRPES